MKKGLLLVGMFAIAFCANAQTMKHEVSSVKKSELVQLGTASMHSNVYAKRQHNAFAAAPAKAYAADNLFRKSIAENEDWEGELTESAYITMEAANVQMEGYDNILNVKLNDFTYEGTETYGYYDEEAGTLTIPSGQKIYDHSQYGGFYLMACKFTNDGQSVSFADENEDYYDLVFDVDDNGILSLNSDYAEGWLNMMYDYEQTENGGYYQWNSGFYTMIYPINGTIEYSCTNNAWKNESGNGWGDGSRDVYVEDFGENVMVHAFLGLAPVSIDINDDGTCILQMYQPMSDLGSQYGGIAYLYGVAVDYDAGTISVDESIESIDGIVDGNWIRFYDVEPRMGDDGETHYYYTWRHYINVTNMSYGFGFFHAPEILWTTGDDEPRTTGIENFNNSLEYKVKNTKTYNLMGQQVNRKNVQGLMIRDGKKYIAK